MTKEICSLTLDVLLLDDQVQPRTGLHAEAVRSYAELLADGVQLPPIVVFQEGEQYWLADGFHRVAAAREAGWRELAAEVRQGSKHDAMVYACGANTTHGLPLSRADKRRVVERMLSDPEWSQWSDYAIARHCGVSSNMVWRYRRDLSTIKAQMPPPVRTVERGGHVYAMDTSRLSKPEGSRPSAPPPAADAPPFRLVSQAPPMKNPPTFNRTNDKVDWAKWTWNPVTGCLHNCIYCYARDIANRHYPQGFAPTFLPERLKAPHYTKVPPQAATEIGFRNVFVCSMADLFGKWVPQEWIDAVLTEIRAAPQWNFLFLTKFPQRLAEIDWPGNAWVGTTVDEQYRVQIAEKAFREVNAPVRWLSCEPLRERLTFSSLEMFDWVVIGGQSWSSQAPEFQPPWEWVDHVMQQARQVGCLVYWKENLHTRPQQYPQGDALRSR